MLAARRRAEAREANVAGRLCGFDAVQPVGGYSGNPGYAIASAASAAGNSNCNGKSD